MSVRWISQTLGATLGFDVATQDSAKPSDWAAASATPAAAPAVTWSEAKPAAPAASERDFSTAFAEPEPKAAPSAVTVREAVICPDGQKLSPEGKCVPAPSVRASSTDWGPLMLLAGAGALLWFAFGKKEEDAKSV